MDERIGVRNEAGAVIQWPAVDINGAAYTRPATTLALDSTHFVVIPVNGVINDTVVAEFQGKLRPAIALSVESTSAKVKRERPEPESKPDRE